MKLWILHHFLNCTMLTSVDLPLNTHPCGLCDRYTRAYLDAYTGDGDDSDSDASGRGPPDLFFEVHATFVTTGRVPLDATMSTPPPPPDFEPKASKVKTTKTMDILAGGSWVHFGADKNGEPTWKGSGFVPSLFYGSDVGMLFLDARTTHPGKEVQQVNHFVFAAPMWTVGDGLMGDFKVMMVHPGILPAAAPPSEHLDLPPRAEPPQ
jgi:hypothetical protein